MKYYKIKDGEYTLEEILGHPKLAFYAGRDLGDEFFKEHGEELVKKLPSSLSYEALHHWPLARVKEHGNDIARGIVQLDALQPVHDLSFTRFRYAVQGLVDANSSSAAFISWPTVRYWYAAAKITKRLMEWRDDGSLSLNLELVPALRFWVNASKIREKVAQSVNTALTAGQKATNAQWWYLKDACANAVAEWPTYIVHAGKRWSRERFQEYAVMFRNKLMDDEKYVYTALLEWEPDLVTEEMWQKAPEKLRERYESVDEEYRSSWVHHLSTEGESWLERDVDYNVLLDAEAFADDVHTKHLLFDGRKLVGNAWQKPGEDSLRLDYVVKEIVETEQYDRLRKPTLDVPEHRADLCRAIALYTHPDYIDALTPATFEKLAEAYDLASSVYQRDGFVEQLPNVLQGDHVLEWSEQIIDYFRSQATGGGNYDREIFERALE